MSQDHIQEHVDLIARHEQDFLAKRTRAERLGDLIAAFTGSLAFVALHLVIFATWIALNTLPAPIHRFDPASCGRRIKTASCLFRPCASSARA